ncbi:FHA domain-containing protein [Leptolyngbya sp. FACHB-261]|uniref:FHA domain-containing protein n=1 Tax=Leptolyngbya sp. FACHB-261 TaxID=2692806 RepID=UPI001688A1CE|nr:FHA domain-containing protein [Leptolyngbya sp. FACHB-261]MBD2102641.1 FHA domain-containing protein [Leptolyngbya sp. FACHB-261]
MANAAPQKHLLIVEDSAGSREFLLQRAKYTLGRDPSSDIQVRSQFVSRQHALLLRLPEAERGQYRYRLIDGDLEGRPSANGLMVRNQRVSSCDLQAGDVVVLGPDAKLTYYRVTPPTTTGQPQLDGTTVGHSSLSPLAQDSPPLN